MNTSTEVARSEWEDDDGREVHGSLYQTQGGAFFLRTVTTWAVRKFDPHEGGYIYEDKEKDDILPLSREAAHEWVLKGDTTILADVFPDPPEAEAKPVASATIYLRVPETLKRRIELSASKAGQSINVWAMRCLERCAAAPVEPIKPDAEDFAAVAKDSGSDAQKYRIAQARKLLRSTIVESENAR